METMSLSRSSYNASIASDDNLENSDKNMLAKIKRLKIEENHIHLSLHKSIRNNCYDTVPFVDTSSQATDYQKFKSNIIDSYRNVKTLFEYVKANTSNAEILKSVDIDDIKMAILELEEKIKTLKKYLHSELINLEREEEELNKNINENPARIYKIKKRPSVHSMSYNEIVPSPVKEMITSSSKCLEVQQFQNFIANSRSRFGGWNEYYHYIFIKSWNKYVQVNCNIDLESYTTSVLKSEAFQSLIDDLLSKLPGFKIEEIISHSQWYLTYIYLKERQKLAIAKWKEKRISIKTQPRNIKEKQNSTLNVIKYDLENGENQSSCKINCDIIKSSLDETMSNSGRYTDGCNDDTICEENNKFLRAACGPRRLPVKYSSPTKQWINRSQNVYDDNRSFFNCPAQISKLRIPKWRVGLQET